jgi:hypothetical protein
MFVTVRHFYPILLFAAYAGHYPGVTDSDTHYTNYSSTVLITNVKSLVKLAPGGIPVGFKDKPAANSRAWWKNFTN